MNRFPQAAPPSEQVAEQLRELADRLAAWPTAIWTRPGADGTAATVGMHIRHCLDHVRAFVDGVAVGGVDYDARARCPSIERDPAVAAAEARALADRIAAVARASGDAAPLSIRVACATEGTERGQGSTVGRELQFLVGHTVHHLAMVAGLLRSFGVAVEPSFGVAPSTLRSRF